MPTYKEKQAEVYAKYGTTDKIPFKLSYYKKYHGDKTQVEPSWTAPPHTKNRTSATSFTNPLKIFTNPLQKWRDSAIYESVELAQPLTKPNMEKHNAAVAHINKMNPAKLATMSSKDVAFLAHKMVENRASHAPVQSTIRKGHKGGGKKKSRKSRKTRKTRRNPIHK